MITSAVIAYIDPGSGSFLLQILIAGVVGCVAYFRRFFLSLLGRGNRKGVPDTPVATVEVRDENDVNASSHGR